MITGPTLTVNRFQASLWEDLVSLGAEIDQSARWTQTVRGLADARPVEPPAVPATLHGRAAARTSSTGTAGCTSSAATTSAGSWPTTWGWARPLQALALICQARLGPARLRRPSWWSRRPAWCRTGLSEAARFAPDLKVVCLTESPAQAAAVRSTEAVAGADLVITSYALLRIEIDAPGRARAGRG